MSNSDSMSAPNEGGSWERELQLEEESLALGASRYRNRLQSQGHTDMPPGLRFLSETVPPLAERLDTFLSAKVRGNKHTLVSFLQGLSTEAVALITLRSMLQGVSERQTSTSTALSIMGVLKEHIEWEMLGQVAPGLRVVMERQLCKASSERHRRAVARHVTRKQDVQLDWSTPKRAKAGMALIQLAIQATGRFRLQRQSNGRGKTPDYVQLTDAAEERLLREHGRCELLEPLYMPMVCEPMDWQGPYKGGYLSRRTTLVKTQNHDYLEDLQTVDMPAVYDAVNRLQRVAWRINPNILRVLREAWEGGHQLAGLPMREDAPLPAKPARWEEIVATKDEDENALAAFRAWKRDAAITYEANAKLVGQRVSVGRKLWLAEKFLHEPRIYFPHTLDWRGRAYPLPVEVHPQADDPGKALLQFAEGKPLGPDGAAWLAIHTATCWGEDKASFEDRIAWVQQHEDDIVAAAARPLEHTWWADAEEPWQFLAACIEWCGYLLQGERYVCHLPVSVDGSCNGLQNFSAMLRDEVGGRATNLLPAEKPADIYQRVADVVAAKVRAAAQAGEGTNAEMAALWQGRITRKLVKRPVMTMPYGVTRVGIRDQLLLEVRKLELLPRDRCWEACAWLTGIVQESIGEVVVAARLAMDWLQEVARGAARDGLPVHWTAPSGFPVVQEYRRWKLHEIRCYLGGVTRKVALNRQSTEIDVKRQALGISPNFVHSCDASHMMATVNLCAEHGVHSLGMVHDSFASLPTDMPALFELLREAFVRQYSEPVLERFREELQGQLPAELAEKFPPMPASGALELEQVRESLFFFA